MCVSTVTYSNYLQGKITNPFSVLYFDVLSKKEWLGSLLKRPFHIVHKVNARRGISICSSACRKVSLALVINELEFAVIDLQPKQSC
jgi:hypothetical protein